MTANPNPSDKIADIYWKFSIGDFVSLLGMIIVAGGYLIHQFVPEAEESKAP